MPTPEDTGSATTRDLQTPGSCCARTWTGEPSLFRSGSSLDREKLREHGVHHGLRPGWPITPASESGSPWRALARSSRPPLHSRLEAGRRRTALRQRVLHSIASAGSVPALTTPRTASPCLASRARRLAQQALDRLAAFDIAVREAGRQLGHQRFQLAQHIARGSPWRRRGREQPPWRVRKPVSGPAVRCRGKYYVSRFSVARGRRTLPRIFDRAAPTGRRTGTGGIG